MILSPLFSLTLLGQVILPGSKLSIQQAKKDAHIVVIAEVVQTGGIILAGVPHMFGIELKPSSVLKGKVKDGELKDLVVTAGALAERLPGKGEEYIFFIRHNAKEAYVIIKMLPNSAGNIAAIRASDRISFHDRGRRAHAQSMGSMRP